jgi:hypothetical protein
VLPGVPVPVIGDPLVGFTTGAVGGTVSTVTTRAVSGLTLPAGSVAVTVRLLVPSGNGVIGVIDQVPSGCTVVVPIVSPFVSLIVIKEAKEV